MRNTSLPKLVASVGSVLQGRREAIEDALQRAIDRAAVGGAKALSEITNGFGPDELLAYCADAIKAGGGA